MKIVNKFQQGGAMAQPATEAPVQQDPIAMLAEMAMQALETQDCAAAMSVCEGFMALISQANAPAPMGSEPAEAPVFRRGGQIRRK